MLYIFLAILAGFSIIFSRILNANMAKIIGIYPGTLMNYVAGLALAVLLVIFIPNQIIYTPNIPIWAFTGGIFGVLVIALSSYVTHRISNFDVTLLIFIGQQITSAILDIILGNTISRPKLIGGILIILGLGYNIIIDRKDNEAATTH